jgi:hypothetical protein
LVFVSRYRYFLLGQSGACKLHSALTGYLDRSEDICHKSVVAYSVPTVLFVKWLSPYGADALVLHFAGHLFGHLLAGEPFHQPQSQIQAGRDAACRSVPSYHHGLAIDKRAITPGRSREFNFL